ncbi:aminotransferase class III-fold pyridoxal phosphate-dependent enzyme, partial [Nocardiopsis rhodophaea]
PLWHGAHPMAPYLRELDGDGRHLVRGTGSRVLDRAGRWYLDARSSAGTGILGHGHPGVREAIQRQAGTLALGGTLLHDQPPQVAVEYAEALAPRLPRRLRRIRLGGGGAHMVEGAVLLSRFHRATIGESARTAVVRLSGGGHRVISGPPPLSGTMGGVRGPRAPLTADLHAAEPGDNPCEAVAAAIERIGASRATAVLVEPVQSVSGAVLDDADLRALALLCRNLGIHLIADETASGFGRAGALSRMLELGVVPDILVFGSSLTAGHVPAGALVVAEELFDDLADPRHGLGFAHGSTTDGNPLVCAAGLAVLNALYDEGVLDAGRARSRQLHETLLRVQREDVPGGAVTGVGLHQRLSLRTLDGDPWLAPEVTMLLRSCECHGLLLSGGPDCVVATPPLTITPAEITEIGDRLHAAFQAHRRVNGAPR